MHHVSAKRHILGGYALRCDAITPKFELGWNALTPKFHHPMFTRSEVIMLTYKPTNAAENIGRSSLRYDVW